MTVFRHLITFMSVHDVWLGRYAAPRHAMPTNCVLRLVVSHTPCRKAGERTNILSRTAACLVCAGHHSFKSILDLSSVPCPCLCHADGGRAVNSLHPGASVRQV